MLLVVAAAVPPSMVELAWETRVILVSIRTLLLGPSSGHTVCRPLGNGSLRAGITFPFR